ncbi:MAG TPA: flagellar protein FlaG [Nevskiaceae bacterium]|nr:flagellar protein FlaG [Nevskiaceae bacterium]
MTPGIGYAAAASAATAVEVPVSAARSGTQTDLSKLPRSANAAAAAAPSRPPAPPPGLQAFDLRFRVDPDLQEVVVTLVDPDSGNVLRQIPSEDALKLAKALESIGKQFFEDQA